MAAVKLEQYLASVLDSTNADTNEVRLKPGNKAFNLFRVYLENHNAGIHRYQTSNPTILYEAEGMAKTKINGQNLTLKAGNLLFLQEKCGYEVEKQEKNDLLVKLEFSSKVNCADFLGEKATLNSREQKVAEQLIQILKTKRLLSLRCSQMSRPSQLMKKVIDEYLNHNLFTRSIIAAELRILVITAIRNQDLETAPANQHKFAQTALERYIDANYTDITLNETAEHFGLNPNYFSSLVKQKTGKSFVEHVDERRMQEARNLLARPDISVKEIIARVGYNGKSFFYKKFNEYYHETPVQMRAELFRQANINLK
ncbi:helix-turn-helix transcriptional regulator [Lactobacillus sp.]|uniref:helix-turn-helix domain-containing protein n=1 Tax=Lactobacillus sp. TaxID=1591 RepID=UPI0025FF2FCF|nr:helix-turn-helix transcriptional regulator [Lactobacillus sp.]MCO6533755.1 helix-turn-helix transcriptional regulator [Lactobacillus sp.]